jgi:hypothetical protein
MKLTFAFLTYLQVPQLERSNSVCGHDILLNKPHLDDPIDLAPFLRPVHVALLLQEKHAQVISLFLESEREKT